MDVLILFPVNHEDTTSDKIYTNYYPITCTESKRSASIKYNFQGKVNDPNIVLHPSKNSKYGKLVMTYQAVELCICPTKNAMAAEFPFLVDSMETHPDGVSETHSDGMIVITHRAISNGPILYSCFPLIYSSPVASPIEQLLHPADTMKQMYQSTPHQLSMNDYVDGEPTVREIEYKSRPCMVLYYHHAIPIRAPEPPPQWTQAPLLSLHEGFQSQGVVENFAMSGISPNGNPNGYGIHTVSCQQNQSPDMSNVPKVSKSYSGNPVQPVKGAAPSSDARCAIFDNNVHANYASSDSMQTFVNDTYNYRKDNDGLNPYLGANGTSDCYQDYMVSHWGGEQNFLNYLIQQKVSIPDYYNFWNPRMVGNGFNPMSAQYNLQGQCYDASTVAFNIGRYESAGYNVAGETVSRVISDASYGVNAVYSGLTQLGKSTVNLLTGKVPPSKGDTPSVIMEVPILDSPDYTYQECTMVSNDGSEMQPVYISSDTQLLTKYNSLIGIIFYFILFLLIYFGTPFFYFLVNCKILKHGFNYSGTTTFSDYLRREQNFLGLGRHRGVSVIFNAIFWIIVLIVWLNTLIPGVDVEQLNTIVILMILGWFIGYIGVKNNPVPESCFY